MIELSSGYLSFEQLDLEVIAIVDDFKAFGVDTVYLTFGFGCDHDARVQSKDVPVRTSDLAQFVADSEADGTFELGDSD